MTPADVVLGILSGLVAGTLAGAFGVGGAIVTTPALRVLLGVPPIVAVGTPLPAIFPTTAVAAWTYRRAGHLDVRAVRWLAPPGLIGSAVGALATDLVDPHLLLVATGALLVWQAVRLTRRPDEPERRGREATGWALAVAGLLAGLASGLLGVGGGIVLVPALAGPLGMPLKRALGTSLVVITVLVVPGTIVHAALGHIDWPVVLSLVVGVVPGARIGALLAVRATDLSLRRMVGLFLGLVGLAYAAGELIALSRG